MAGADVALRLSHRASRIWPRQQGHGLPPRPTDVQGLEVRCSAFRGLARPGFHAVFKVFDGVWSLFLDVFGVAGGCQVPRKDLEFAFTVDNDSRCNVGSLESRRRTHFGPTFQGIEPENGGETSFSEGDGSRKRLGYRCLESGETSRILSERRSVPR